MEKAGVCRSAREYACPTMRNISRFSALMAEPSPTAEAAATSAPMIPLLLRTSRLVSEAALSQPSDEPFLFIDEPFIDSISFHV